MYILLDNVLQRLHGVYILTEKLSLAIFFLQNRNHCIKSENDCRIGRFENFIEIERLHVIEICV